MTRLSVILSVLVLIALKVNCQDPKKRCTLIIDDVEVTDSLLMDEGNNLVRLNSTDSGNVVEVEDGKTLNVSCTEIFNTIKMFGTNYIKLECKNGNLSYNEFTNIERSGQLQCEKLVEISLIPTKRFSCFDGLESYQIGFSYKFGIINDFLYVINICRNDTIRRTDHTFFTMRHDAYYTTSTKMPTIEFKGADDELYKNNLKQLKDIEEELDGIKFDNTRNYLARGHLTANADMVFAPEMAATYYYYNAAPQWQGFNAGNWLRVEKQLRKYLVVNKKDLVVFTGVFGNLSLPMKRTKGTTKNIYLDMTGEVLPVPEFFWKVLENTTTAIVGYNNIFVDETEALKKANSFCVVIECYETGWFDVGRNEANKGFIFCCQLNADFLNKIGLRLHQNAEEEIFGVDADGVQSSTLKFLIVMLLIIYIVLLLLLYRNVDSTVLLKQPKRLFKLIK